MSGYIKKFAISIAILVSLFFVHPVLTLAQDQTGEHIENMVVDIYVNTDATINVKEDILYDFSDLSRHGIYRDIPINYKTDLGDNFSFKLSDISVTDASSSSYPFSLSKTGSNQRIKIGDPNSTITGLHHYIISYTVDRPIGYFADHDEIYWNVTGNDWLVPIARSSATVHLPKAISHDQLKIACYLGVRGGKEGCPITIEDSSGSTIVRFEESRMLHTGEGTTVAVGFPKGVVTQSTATENFWSYIADNIVVYLLPLIVFLVMFITWYYKGRDPKGTGVIVPYYDVPDGLTPLEVGGILKYRSRSKDLSAEIIYLAVNGYIRIEQVDGAGFFGQKDYILHKLKDFDYISNDHDRLLMDSLFSRGANALPSVAMSSLVDTFYNDARDVQTAAMNNLVKNGYFEKPPKVGESKMVGSIGSTIILVIWGGTFISGMFGLSGLVSIIASAIIFIAFMAIMPRRTEKGTATYEKLLGLKEYLQIAEKDRINFHNAPEKKPEIFEKLLPYAMVFGVEKAWAKEFEGIYTTPPNWYQGSSFNSFSTGVFVSHLSSFSTSASHTLSSSPSSGGGGFGGGGGSGGGGGGGGGGGW